MDEQLTDPTTEAALIGGLMLDEGAWDAVSDLFRPEIFSHAAHRAAAEAILGLAASRKPIDAVTLFAALGENEEARTAVFQATSGLGSSGNARAYCEQLRELWARRELKRIARSLFEDSQGDAAARISRAAQALNAVESAKPIRARPLSHLVLDLLTELDDQRKNPNGGHGDALIPSGFAKLDESIGGFRPGVLAIFAARPSVGKSAFAVSLLDNLTAQGHAAGVFWLEDDWRDLTRRMLARRAKVRSLLLRNGSFLHVEHWDRLSSAAEALSTRKIFVDDTHGLTALDIANRMRRMHREHGCKVFFADHLGEIGIEREDRWGDRHDLAVGRAARVFRDTAKDLGAVPILLAQMNRQVERRTDSSPRLADLDGSGQIEQAARLVGFLSRPQDEKGQGTGEFCIDLVKNTNGPTGRVTLRWLEDRMTIEEPQQPTMWSGREAAAGGA